MIYGTFEMCPAIFDDSGPPYETKEAWVCYGREWVKMPWDEVYPNGKITCPPWTEAEFWATYTDLPPLPKTAFMRLRYGVFTSLPCIWNDDTGWVLYGNSGTSADWREHHTAEIMTTARPISYREFKLSFPNLPPLPCDDS
jgi:hypothetical protein